jgi:hypothetical protein
MMQAQLQDLMS